MSRRALPQTGLPLADAFALVSQVVPDKRPCSCGLYRVELGRAFYGEGGSIHAERTCSDWYGDPIAPAKATAAALESQGQTTLLP